MTTQTTTENTHRSSRFEIVEGPSKFDLMASLGVWKPERHRVEFKNAQGEIISATINGIDAEDGSGNCWIVRGQGHHKNAGVRLHINIRFEGFYRSGGPGGKGGYLNFKK